MAEIERCVWVLVNPKSGARRTFEPMRRALDETWDVAGTELCYQFCQSVKDSVDKARRAVQRGVDVLLVAGGDGTVNTIGRELIDTPVALGIIPCGSGNGFARHFEIPLAPDQAVRALAGADRRSIDVGIVNGHPFLVTCSLAWEAALTEAFERSPVRGILPYVFAGMQGLLEYEPQDMTIVLDSEQEIFLDKPMLCTVANLTQYGGGARIAPEALEDDGMLELVVALQQDVPAVIANTGRLFDGSLASLPQIRTYRFRDLQIRRQRTAAIQVDGEVMQAPADLQVHVRPACLTVLVP